MTLSEFETLCRTRGVKALRVWLHPFGDDAATNVSVDVIATIEPDTMHATYGAKTMVEALKIVAGEIEGKR